MKRQERTKNPPHPPAANRVPGVATPAPADRLNLISQQGLCIGCGLCEAIAGSDRVRCLLTPNGYERPVVVGGLDHATVDEIYAVCPGVKVTGLPADLADGATMDPVWGPWRRVVRGWAAEPAVRHVGSTGGVLTALGMHVLDAGRVEAVLHAAPSATEPGFGQAQISRSSADVLKAAGSRYGPTAVLSKLDEALTDGGPLALIAKPCDISAVRLRARSDDRINRQIRYWLTLVCGGMMAPAGTAARMREHGINPAEVTAIRYRGHGCPGPTRFELTGGRAVEITYLEFWGDDESQWRLPYRCKICPDGTGEGADVAAADTWSGGTPAFDRLSGDPGTNVVIARTATGAALLEDAVASGHLALGEDAAIADLDEWQPHHVRKKMWSWARQLGRRRAGVLPIETGGLRAEQLARTRRRGELLEQARGSLSRVHDGRANEPVPVALASTGVPEADPPR